MTQTKRLFKPRVQSKNRFVSNVCADDNTNDSWSCCCILWRVLQGQSWSSSHYSQEESLQTEYCLRWSSWKVLEDTELLSLKKKQNKPTGWWVLQLGSRPVRNSNHWGQTTAANRNLKIKRQPIRKYVGMHSATPKTTRDTPSLWTLTTTAHLSTQQSPPTLSPFVQNHKHGLFTGNFLSSPGSSTGTPSAISTVPFRNSLDVYAVNNGALPVKGL